METKQIGAVPMKPTVLGLGCWAFGGSQWGPQNDRDSIEAIRAAFDNGITHFDTAQGYGKGHSEELLGEALKGVARDRVFIASKMFLSPKVTSTEVVELSLNRLRTDYIDLFYIHWPKKGVDLRIVMEELVAIRESGRIRGIGVSNLSVDQMKTVTEVGRVDAHQLCYNLLWRWDEHDTMPFCKEHGISVVTYSSIAQGILTGKFPKNIDFQEGDHRKGTVLFDPEVWPGVYESVEQMKSLASEVNCPLAQLAIRWVCSRDGVDSVLVGARNPGQVVQNVQAFREEVPPEVLDKLTSISNDAIHRIPDTGNIFRWYPG